LCRYFNVGNSDRIEGVAQVVKHLLSKFKALEFKSQYQKKKIVTFFLKIISWRWFKA
jgi:hypothetical protein